MYKGTAQTRKPDEPGLRLKAPEEGGRPQAGEPPGWGPAPGAGSGGTEQQPGAGRHEGHPGPDVPPGSRSLPLMYFKFQVGLNEGVNPRQTDPKASGNSGFALVSARASHLQTGPACGPRLLVRLEVCWKDARSLGVREQAPARGGRTQTTPSGALSPLLRTAGQPASPASVGMPRP